MTKLFSITSSIIVIIKPKTKWDYYALSKFSITEYPERVFATVEKIDDGKTSLAIIEAERRFSVIASVSDYS